MLTPFPPRAAVAGSGPAERTGRGCITPVKHRQQGNGAADGELLGNPLLIFASLALVRVAGAA